ncbi:MAG: HYR domain-containing protein, partial [Acidimicrobiia bacterium]
GDGTTVVGESNSEAFLWSATAPNSLLGLGFVGGDSFSKAKGVSYDGSVVVGVSNSRAFRWDSTSQTMVSLGTLEGNTGSSLANDCSADGSIVVGQSSTAVDSRGFRWTQATGMVSLDPIPQFPNKHDEANAVSADGLEAVGEAGCCEAGGLVSVRWPNGGSVAESIGDLSTTPPESPWGAAAGISADGTVIVGGGGAAQRPYRWNAVNGITELVPNLFTNWGSAMDTSGDGLVIVGSITDGTPGSPEYNVKSPMGPIPDGLAFIWTEATGLLDLKTHLVGLGLGAEVECWRLEAATGISDDGNIIVGYGTRNGAPKREGWVAALSGNPFPSDGGCEPPPPPPDFSFEVGFFYAGLKEAHGFLWHPTKGPIPIDPDPPPEILGPAAEGGARWVEGIIGSRTNEQQWAILSKSNTAEADFRMLKFDGIAWNVEWKSKKSGKEEAPSDSPGFDSAHEDRSGDAVTVYETGAGTPRYRTYIGGTWSEEQILPRNDAPDEVKNLVEGIVEWVKLAARPGTNEIALVYLDDRGNLLAWVWDGSRWLSESAALLASDVRTSQAIGRAQSRAFDVVYETLSGTLLVAWSRKAEDGFYYARKTPGTETWSSPVREDLPGLGVEFVDLAAEPTSNLVAGAFIGLQILRGGPASERLGLSVWDSQRWRDTGEYDDSLRAVDAAALPALPAAVGWAGTSRDAICVYADQEAGTLDWARWRSDTGWSIQADVDVPGKGLTESARLTGSSDSGLLSLLSDSKAQLYAIQYDSSGTWRLIGDIPLGQELAAANTAPFGLTLSRRDTLFVGDATAGGRQEGDLGRAGTVELLSFSLVPRGSQRRVEALAFSLEEVTGVSRDDWSNIELVVDENANGTVDAAETTTLAGVGFADSTERLVFLEPFDVSTPTHYVLRANLPALGRNAQVIVSLPGAGVVSPSAAARGLARRHLDFGGAGVDTTPPVLTCPADVTRAADENCQAAYVSPGAMATDDLDPNPIMTSDPALPAIFSGLGEHSITYTAADASGNINVCVQTVTVVDDTAPALSAQWVPLNVKKHRDNDKDEDKGEFRLEFSAADACDTALQVTGVVQTPPIVGLKVKLKTRSRVKVKFDLKKGKVEIRGPNPKALLAQIEESGGLVVHSGQLVKVDLKQAKKGKQKKQEFKFEKGGKLKIKTPSAILMVIGEDASGNTAAVQVSPQFAPKDKDNDRSKKRRKHKDRGKDHDKDDD